MVAIFSEIFNMSQWTTWFENNPYFHKYSTDELTHNTPEHLQTCHKINNSIVSYKTVDE